MNSRFTWTTVKTPIRIRSTFGDWNENRLANMAIAAQRLTLYSIAPHHTFSFWNVIPPPTPENGFLKGPCLINGRISEGSGGGLCQVSTTLFMAFLLTDFKILERHHHSIDAHGEGRFFTLGQDAAVAHGIKDLRVQNMNDFPVTLSLVLDRAEPSLTVSLFADRPLPQKVNVQSTILEKIDPAEKNGKPGWRVQTRRAVDGQGETYAALDFYRPWYE